MPRPVLLLCLSLLTLATPPLAAADSPLRIAPFRADITPPLGTALCDGLVVPASEIVDHLTARGVVLLSDEPPVVLCACDWVGIGNAGYDDFRDALAKAAGTTRNRVSVNCLHQHDAPGCDFLADEILSGVGLGNKLFDVPFARKAMQRTADAVKLALQHPRTVTQLGIGKGKVEQVASNRRVLGPNGKVAYVRYSAAKDEFGRTAPEGVIDPYVQVLSFWDGDKPVAGISYYATHPQSYYGKGGVSADFPGMARGLFEASLPGVPCIHFNGASGNVTAGKYNDGSPAMRPVLAERLATGMKLAWANTVKTPIKASDLEWRVIPVSLPPAKALDAAKLKETVANDKLKPVDRLRAARNLAWLNRCLAGHQIDLTCLRLGPAYVLNMPGELFIEYQLAAQKLRPESPVLMAAYGDYAPGYIGTKAAYPQGGYETGPVSRVAPEVEDVLLKGIAELLK